MDIKEKDIVNLNWILEYIGNKGPIRYESVEKELGIDRDEVSRLHLILIKHKAVNPNFEELFSQNSNTIKFCDINYFSNVFSEQEEAKQRQNEIDLERKINIRNAKWALPTSIIAIIISIMALVASFLGK